MFEWMTPAWLVSPMAEVMQAVMEYTGSYGVAIIVLTIVVRILILPLTIYQTKSMKQMQEAQPLIKQLQEKHKGEPEKLNEAMMALYKSRGVNPMAGCLPMLIQMPFLYAMFAALQRFNPAPFYPGFLWIPDLSAKDPLLLLPIITVAAMIVQNYLSGMGSDPNQKMMLYIMPVMFGWISYTMPQSGVVLYWVVSTLFGLAQQAIYPGFPRLKGTMVGKGEGGTR